MVEKDVKAIKGALIVVAVAIVAFVVVDYYKSSINLEGWKRESTTRSEARLQAMRCYTSLAQLVPSTGSMFDRWNRKKAHDACMRNNGYEPKYWWE